MSNGDSKPEGYTFSEWRTILHRAAIAAKKDPTDREAVEWRDRALRHISASEIGGIMQERTEAEHVGPVESMVGGLVHGASLGTGELFRGAGRAIQEGVKSTLGQPALPEGQAFRQGAQEYRDALSSMEASNPNLTATAELAGPFALPAAAIGQAGARGIQAGVPLTLAQGAQRVGSGMVGAAVPGFVGGFAAGGEDPGDLGARVRGGVHGAILNALLAGVTTPLVMRATRGHVERAADIRNRGTMRALQEQRLINARTAGARATAREAPTIDPDVAEMQYLHEHPEVWRPQATRSPDVEQAITDFEAGKISGEDLRTALAFDKGDVPPEPPAPAGPPRPATASRPDALRGLSEEQLRALPGGELATTPPLEQSAAAPEAQARQIRQVSERMLQRERGPARVVSAGRYQRAAPATRMLSTPEGPSALERALMQNPEDVVGVLRTQLELGKLFGGDPQALRAVEDALKVAEPTSTPTTAPRQFGHMAGDVTVKQGGVTYQIPRSWLVGATQGGKMTTQQAVAHWIEQTEAGAGRP